MMQSYASAAKLRGGGPILNRGAQAMSNIGLPPPRSSSAVSDGYAGGLQKPLPSLRAGRSSRSCAKGKAFRYLASGRQSPQHDQELAGERHNHGLARHAARICSSCTIPLGQNAVRLVHQEAPGKLQHPTAHAGVAGFGKTALTSLLTALVRSSRQTGVSRHCFAIPQVAGENLLYQHIGRLDTNPDHPGEQADHRIASFSGCPLQSLNAAGLNLLDLLFDKAEASHVAP